MPQCLTLVHNDAGEQIVYGDSKGAAIMLLCGSREWPARDMISGAEHQDYIMVHQVSKGIRKHDGILGLDCSLQKGFLGSRILQNKAECS